MKTAMQEWFDELKANYPYMANEIYEKGFQKYLEKEKEQIIIAYIHNRYVLAGGHPIRRDYAEEYYNQTYIIQIDKSGEWFAKNADIKIEIAKNK